MKYNLTMRINHWLIGLTMITVAIVGLYMTSLPSDDPSKYGFYPLHKSFGLLLLMLVCIRALVRISSKIPALPNSITRFDGFIAKTVIALMYFVMFALPISGYFMSVYGGHPVQFFGIDVPNLVSPDPIMGKFAYEAHETLGLSFLVLVGLHVVGWLKHLVVERTNLLERII